MLFLFEKGVDKFVAVEELQVGHFFSYANVLHRNFELVGDADYYTSFGSAVQFGDG